MEKKVVSAIMLTLLLAGIASNLMPTVCSSIAKLYINPPISFATPGESFTVDINVADVENLYAWQVNMCFDPNVLEFVNVTEGDFLKDQPEGTYKGGPRIEEAWVMFGWTTSGKYLGVSGSGTLATVEFLVVGVGESIINITNPWTLLFKLGVTLLEIPCTTENGFFTIPPRVIYVDDDNTAGPWDGSIEHPYKNITSGLDHASSGDTIFVYNGTYYETVVVNKTVSLIGENRETTIIDGGEKDFARLVEVNCSNVVLKEFTLNMSGLFSSHVFLGPTFNTSVASNNLVGHAGGIGVGSSKNITLTRNNITRAPGANVPSIEVFNCSNVLVTENTIAKGWEDGIILYSSSNVRIIGNNLTENAGSAIYFIDSSNNTIADNRITGYWDAHLGYYNGIGIQMHASITENASSFNTFHDNDIRNCFRAIMATVYEGVEAHHNNVFLRNNITNSNGIYLRNCLNFTFEDNGLSGNRSNIGIYGDALAHYVHDIGTSNTVNDKPVYYILNQQNLTINPSTHPDIGYLALINSTNIRVENLHLKEKNDQGLLMVQTRNCTVTNNFIENYSIGINLDVSSSNNTLSGNNIAAGVDGVLLEHSFNNTLAHNTLLNNRRGVYLKGSFNNTLVDNNLINNSRGGVWLDYSTNNVLVSNNIVDNQASAISDAGVSLYQSYVNKIYSNNFINNQRHVYTCLGNIWDNGYPSGGNYWSNYTGVDLYNGSGQNETGSDGIGDTPHVIDLGIQDKYPLVVPKGWIPIFWDEVVYPVELDSNSTISRFQFKALQRMISYNVTGPDGTIGFCNLTTPNSLVQDLWQGMELTVLVDGEEPLIMNNWTDGTYTYIYFTYQHSTHEVVIQWLDTTPPTISVLSPENKTYPANNVSLTFTVSESTSWIGYCLNSQMNVTISGNTTIVGLSDGTHTITVYANDTAGNMGYSDTVNFTVDTVLPNIEILSPENKTYTTSSVSLSFIVDEATSWIAYSLDGQINMTITGNTTLSELSDSPHSLIVYARDTAGNTGASETVYFSVETPPPEPFPIWIVATIVTIAVVGASLLVYFLKIKKTTEKIK